MRPLTNNVRAAVGASTSWALFVYGGKTSTEFVACNRHRPIVVDPDRTARQH